MMGQKVWGIQIFLVELKPITCGLISSIRVSFKSVRLVMLKHLLDCLTTGPRARLLYCHHTCYRKPLC